MAATIAGEVLGLRPGRAICSFWQGNVETALRVAGIVVGAVPVLISAAVALGTVSASSSRPGPLPINLSALSILSQADSDILGSAGYLVALSVLAMIVEVFIIVRVLDIGLINLKIKIFLAIDMVLSGLLALGYIYIAGGIAVAAVAGENSLIDAYRQLGVQSEVFNGMVAAAVFCFVAGLIFVTLAVWSVMFIVKDLNKKVVTYTLKEAVTG